MKCHECQSFRTIQNTQETGQGLCTFSGSYFPVNQNDLCLICGNSTPTCGDCSRYSSDLACLTCNPTDSALIDGHLCRGFIDKHEENVEEALFRWRLQGIDIDQKLNDIKARIWQRKIPQYKEDIKE